MNHYRIHEQDEQGHWHVYRFTEESADDALALVLIREQRGMYSKELARRLTDQWEGHYDEQLRRQHARSHSALSRFVILFVCVGFVLKVLA